MYPDTLGKPLEYSYLDPCANWSSFFFFDFYLIIVSTIGNKNPINLQDEKRTRSLGRGIEQI